MRRHSTLSDERETLLRNIGFCWNSHHAAWMEHFQALLKYRESHGHCNVPSPPSHSRKRKTAAVSASASSSNSGTKVATGNYVNGNTKSKRCCHSRKDGLGCNDNRTISKNIHGSNAESGSELLGDGNGGDPNRGLAIWVKCQRRQYKLFLQNDPRSTMTAERVARLEGVGFDWNPSKLPQVTNK